MQVNKPTTESVEIRCTLFDEDEKPIGFYSGFVIDTLGGEVNVPMSDGSKLGFVLLSGIPNPASERTTIHYYLENSEYVYLDLYDETGRHV